MLRIGIVGAENSHTVAVAKTLNIEGAVPGAKVVMVWGETKAFAEKAAADGQIPTIVKHPEDMIGHVDGVMVDHRHAKYHVPAATPFVEAKIPVFVDKPFSWTVKEGWKFIQLARRKRVPVTSFSVLPEQTSFKADLMKQVKAAGKITSISSVGPCDLKSKWGGIFFYGIHQVDEILKAFGYGIETVQVLKASKGNPNAVAVMTYANGGPIATMELVAEGNTYFVFHAVGTNARVDYVYKSDPNGYLNGIKKFVKMFRTGKEPHSPREMLEPIAVLSALAKSVKSGQRVKVEAIPG